MRKYLLLLAGLLAFTSCSEYLDVKPKSEIDKDVLFQTQEGFQESLLGVYARCSKADLYGYELTCGFLDVLAQNYTVNDLPDVFEPEKYDYEQTMRFNYQDKYFINRKNAVWLGLYNAISNANLILENIEPKQKVFREASTYQLIKGEALALRAYLHFDLLRLFAPSYQRNPNALSIPYVTKFSNQITPQSTVNEVLKKGIEDLVAAKALLKESDRILSSGYVIGYNKDDGSTEQETSLFLQDRRHRLNYYAVCGILARYYLYQNDKAKALENALEVMTAQKFPWTNKLDFTADKEEDKDRILYKELLCGWYAPKMNDEIHKRFEDDEKGLFMVEAEANIFYEVGGIGGEDFRYKQWLNGKTASGVNRAFVRKYHREQDNKHPLVIPAIRLSEIYFIAAECVFDTDPEKAWDYFNTVRYYRGIGTEIHDEPSKEVFLTELVKECRKEFLGEGQIFYMYKRLNRNIVGQANKEYAASDNIFVLPFPDDEIAFGQR